MAKELYVGHISGNATEEDIYKLFSVMGTVTSIHLIVDPETKEFKHCGYVRMTGVDLKEVAEGLDGALLIDQVITVSIARPQKPGTSKSGRGGKFGGPRKPAMGASTGPSQGKNSHSRSSGPTSSSGERRKVKGGPASGAGPRPAKGTGQKSGRAGGPSGRISHRTSRSK